MKRFLCLLFSTILLSCIVDNKVYANENAITNVNDKLEVSFIAEENVDRKICTKEKIIETYRKNSSTYIAMSLDYDNYVKMPDSIINEIIADGTSIIVNITEENQAENIVYSTYSDREYEVECEIESGKVVSVYLTEYNGEVVIGFIGEVNYKAAEINGIVDGDAYEFINDVQNSYHYIPSVVADEMGIDDFSKDIEKSDFNFQTVNLNTYVEPAQMVTIIYDGSEKLGITRITSYVYAGKKYEKNAYDYVISKIEVCPTSKYYIREFTTRIQSKNSYTSIFDASYIDSDSGTTSYSLGISGGISGDGGLSTTYNNSITNTYSSSSMDVKEKFANMDSGYVEWYAVPKSREYGQARCIEPGVVIKINDYSNYKHFANIQTQLSNAQFAEKVLGIFYSGITTDSKLGITFGHK